jgi:hypothetical protein
LGLPRAILEAHAAYEAGTREYAESRNMPQFILVLWPFAIQNASRRAAAATSAAPAQDATLSSSPH